MAKKRNRMTKSQVEYLKKRAWDHIHSVPYKVSLRWVFYRLLQDGIYKEKGDYEHKWKNQASKWRHDGTWPPDLLEDASREVVYRGVSRAWSGEKIIQRLSDSDRLAMYLKDSHFIDQGCYTELWFEARAMTEQFRHYTRGVVLRPFGGSYSIPLKYLAAKELAQYASEFNKPAVVLYFGDSDDAGQTIFKSSTTGKKGFTKWCEIPVEVVWCGLTEEQAHYYNVPEDPDHPGKWQWEALTDEQAREIITHGVQEYIDEDLIDKAEEKGREQAEELSLRIQNALKDI